MDGVETVNASRWETWLEKNQGVVLDVREPYEWEAGTLPGALCISMSEIPQRIGELPRDRPLLCVCRSGARSHQVAAFLLISGFEGATNMVGGMKALGLQD